MKIIRHGLRAEDGIHITCDVCGCEFLLESRDDFKIQYIHSYIQIPEYNIVCPECGYETYIGTDPEVVNSIEVDAFYNPYGEYFFSRKDWKERYEVKCSEQ